MRTLAALLLATLLGCQQAALAQQTAPPAPPPDAAPPDTFFNPLLHTGPDPWVVYWHGFYYYSNSAGTALVLRKTANITDLRNAAKKAVWAPEPGHPWSQELWAPELHRWGNKWYIYFAADAGDNASHRIYVVENENDDPFTGTWTFRGKIADASDRWAIDPTTFELNGDHFLVWSGWKGANDGEQDLFIAHMSNPWTLDSPRSLIARPTFPWETHGDLPGRRVLVNEGPEVLLHGTRVVLTFSASGCWTDFYTLGVLQADQTANLLDPKSWTKVPHPFFRTDPAAQAYGPGHNGFFQSPDGKENWIIYHANPAPGLGCKNDRSPRIQRFSWNPDDTPNFGRPHPLDQPIRKPSQ